MNISIRLNAVEAPSTVIDESSDGITVSAYLPYHHSHDGGTSERVGGYGRGGREKVVRSKSK